MTELGGKKTSSQTGSEVNILTAQPTAPGRGWHVPQNALGLRILGQRLAQLVSQTSRTTWLWLCQTQGTMPGLVRGLQKPSGRGAEKAKETRVSPSVRREGRAINWAPPPSWNSRAAPGQATLTETPQSTHPGDRSKEFQMKSGSFSHSEFSPKAAGWQEE